MISGFIDQYLRLTIEQKQTFEADLRQLTHQEKGDVVEIVTSWMEEGIEKGERRLVLRLLRRQLGELDSAALKQIETLSIDRLEDLGEALLGFTSDQDLVNWLQSHRS